MNSQKIVFPLIIVLMILTTSCQSNVEPVLLMPTPTVNLTPESTPTRSPLLIKVDMTQTRQTLRDVGGGNYIHAFGGVQQALDPVSTMNLNMLDSQVVRVRIDMDIWQPLPGNAGDDRFHDESFVKATIDFIRTLKQRSPQAILIASIWDVPNWMVSNPDAEQARIIPVENYPAVIDSIAHWLVRVRDDAGAAIDYLSFNEADIGINILLSPQDQIDFIRQAGPKFEQMGLTTRWLLGDTHNIAAATSYIPPIYAEEAIRPYLGPLSFHSWDAQVADQLIRQIGQYADENDLEVWCAESGWDPSQWNRPEEFSTWKHAIRLANIDTRVLRDSHTTTILYWQMMGQDYALNDGQQPFPALLYLSELKKHFPAGAQIVATPDDEIQTLSILSLAAILPNDGFSVQIVNQVNETRSVILTGIPDGTYRFVRLSEANQREALADATVINGQINLQLPPMSISFLSR